MRCGNKPPTALSYVHTFCILPLPVGSLKLEENCFTYFEQFVLCQCFALVDTVVTFHYWLRSNFGTGFEL